MNIIIGGDLVPTKSNIELFMNSNIKKNLDKKFIDEWYNSDYRILNLECPICDEGNKILKFGPHLSVCKSAINGIKELNPSLLLLSNNHILDYGTDGLNQTIDILNKNNINYTGIIDNNTKMNRTFIFEKDGIKVGIYNICDTEFSVATRTKKGAAGLNILKNYLEIQEAKKQCDYLIIIYHGGKEYYRYPTPKLRDLCRYFVELGGDIVICQHSHCIGSAEKYNNGNIIYGIGNFIFDDSDNEYEKNSLLVKINFTKEDYKIDYFPIDKKNNLIKASSNKKITLEFEKRNKEIIDEKFIDEEFKNYSKNKLNNYISIFYRVNLFTKIINKFFIKNYYIKKYKKEDLIRILNIIECEAHREVIITALKEYLGDVQNEDSY